MSFASNASASFNRMPLVALALGSFGIGTTEFVIMGLLPDVARSLAATIPEAGLLVTGYALSVAFGSPFLAIATAQLGRRRTLLLLMAVFIVGNVLCAVAPTYSLLMAARVVTALCHGSFFGLGAVVAATLVPPVRRAQAVSAMFSGLTIANVLGVPLGTALGGVLGWRAAFGAVSGIGLLAAGALYGWLPRRIPVPKVELHHEARAMARPQVILAMLVSAMSSASLFSVFTYVTPILEEVTRVSPRTVTAVLLLFGIGVTIGNLIGGRLGDWRLMPSVLGILTLLIPVLALLSVTSRSLPAASVTIFCWGCLAFALLSPLQTRVVNEASLAPNLASTLNQSAFNLGNAIGAWVGSVSLTHGVPYHGLPWWELAWQPSPSCWRSLPSAWMRP
jgi:DHA1 family inner membrane transport protein